MSAGSHGSRSPSTAADTSHEFSLDRVKLEDHGPFYGDPFVTPKVSIKTPSTGVAAFDDSNLATEIRRPVLEKSSTTNGFGTTVPARAVSLPPCTPTSGMVIGSKKADGARTSFVGTPTSSLFPMTFGSPNRNNHSTAENELSTANAITTMGTSIKHELDLDLDESSRVSAYARLDFESFTFYVQTLQVILGRRAENGTGMVDVHLGPAKAISRRHAKIFYNFGTQRFELSVLGRNGAFVGDVFVETGSTVPLRDGYVLSAWV
jgi:hypothetical protein